MPQPSEIQPNESAYKRQQNELEILIRARYPLIYVTSWEEQRVLSQINKIAEKLGKTVYEWSITSGLTLTSNSAKGKRSDTSSQDPLIALGDVAEHIEPALYVFKDFHPFLKGQNTAVVRQLRELSSSLKNTFKTVILISPMFQIPADLEKDITVIDFDLPKENDFTVLLNRIIEEVKANPKLKVNIDAKMREKIVHSLLGLTLSEAENVLAKTLVQHSGFSDQSLQVINNEKKQIILKSGILQYYDTDEKLDTVGGLDALKNWLLKRSIVFTDQARQYGLPAPKGLLLLGVQGCGKSLTAKAISNIWRLPLLRFDIGQVFGSLVGSSEENIRRAIKVAESVSPVVFWVDEIDKAFRGSRGSGASTDGGTSARVFGTFLTWLSEKKQPVFVVATANDISMLPPELLRKGRFDEIFFVDLPSFIERKEIFKVHLEKRKLNLETFNLDILSQFSIGFSGAEIEEAIISALFDSFYDKGQLTNERILATLKQTVPLSKTMNEEIEKLRQWAEGRARFATSSEKAQEPEHGKRQIEI